MRWRSADKAVRSAGCSHALELIPPRVVRVVVRAPALLISRLVSWVDDLWCRAIGAEV
ncbi:hypothetical protein I551_9078 [Mycobacterium ulcerans str. Harvey]|uniref:Uncharacterized protein n=1 Tax=Mycobacterium ulcerans str. Harvey TaxID=1299332 RepID=A0ABN0R9C6_MYCUL|nr:hypothetical protein I551_4455 [Mycobacterium ulcerans str. Harvey]EUA93660.1 hypothetical protein I551_9078 [Mycobacterium ulcerans str. Harvey]